MSINYHKSEKYKNDKSHLIQNKWKLSVLPHDEALSDDGKQGSQFEPKGCHALSDPRNLSIIALLKCPCSFTAPVSWTRLLDEDVDVLDSVGHPQRLPWGPSSVGVANKHLGAVAIKITNQSQPQLFPIQHPIPRKEEFYNHITSQHGTSRSKRLKGFFLWSTETSPSCITARQALIRAMSTSGSPPSFSWNRR